MDEKEPDKLHFGISIDAQAMEAGTVQVHRSVEKMTRHMKAIEPMQPEGFELIDVTQIAVRIYGAPTPADLDRRERSSGRPVSA